jgi:hypothetical protein
VNESIARIHELFPAEIPKPVLIRIRLIRILVERLGGADVQKIRKIMDDIDLDGAQLENIHLKSQLFVEKMLLKLFEGEPVERLKDEALKALEPSDCFEDTVTGRYRSEICTLAAKSHLKPEEREAIFRSHRLSLPFV